jgi:hypothetical protein
MRSTVIMTDSDGAIHNIRVSFSSELRHKKTYDMLGIKDPLDKVHLKL